MPQGAVVTGTLSINSQTLLGNIALATATVLRREKETLGESQGKYDPALIPGATHICSLGALVGSIGGAASQRGRAVVGAVFELSLGGRFAQSSALARQGHLSDPQHLLLVALHKEQQGRNLQEIEKRSNDHEESTVHHHYATRVPCERSTSSSLARL